MTTPTPDDGSHYIYVEAVHAGDRIVKCLCKWRSPGSYYHPKRAEAAGERHIKEQQ
jgi:hypothetical protein